MPFGNLYLRKIKRPEDLEGMEEMETMAKLPNGEPVMMSELEKLAALIAQDFMTCLDEAFDRLMEPEAGAEFDLTEVSAKPLTVAAKPLTRVAGRG